MRLLSLILGLMLATGCGPHAVPQAGIEHPGTPHETSFEVIADELTSSGFSGAVAVVKDGKLVFSRAFGISGPGRPMQPGTAVDVMSIAKVFTAAAVLELAHAGDLSLDDPLGNFYEDVHGNKGQITLRQLLTHTSGIPDFIEGLDDYSRVARQEVVSDLLSGPLEFQPGEDESYSNGGYLILAEIVERVSGQDLESFLQARFFGPPGLAASYDPMAFEQVAGGRDHFSGTAAWMDLRTTAAAANGPFGALWGAGGLYAPFEDIVTAINLFTLEQGPLSHLRQMALTPVAPDADRTLVFDLDRSNSGICIFHHGGDASFARATVRHYPSIGLTVGVWANSISPSAHRVARLVEDKIGASCSEPRQAPSVAGQPLNAESEEFSLLRRYLEALASESIVERGEFVEESVTASYRERSGGADELVLRLGRIWWSLGRPEILFSFVRREPEGATGLTRILDSSEPRLFWVHLSFEGPPGQRRISDISWSPVD